MRFFFCLLFVFPLLADEFPSLTCIEHTYKSETASFSYTAITGAFPLPTTDAEGTPPEIFFIAYLKEGKPNRPITFIFPGGPGGSAGVEAICTFGPRRILTPEEGKPLLPPYRLIDNPETLLTHTDLVFVDPVGTGFSTFGDAEEWPLLSVDGDIDALADFLRTFVAYFNRWNSPKYLSGISYGAARCCGLSEALSARGFSLNGIILLSPAIDYSTLMSQQNLILPDSLLIPTFAATAWYHGRLWPDLSLDEVVDYARRFTFEDYIPAMHQPYRLSKVQQDQFYKNLGSLIGLHPDTVRRYQGRFEVFLYATEFFATERKAIGIYDTRQIGDLSATQREGLMDDPSSRSMQGLLCAFNEYLQEDLETDHPFDPYIAFAPVIRRWDFNTYDSHAWPDLMQRVRRTLVRNPQMKIFVGSGYYDAVTPLAATEYCFEHLDLPLSYKKNIQFEYYEAGHAFIFHHPSLKKLKQSLDTFYTAYEQH